MALVSCSRIHVQSWKQCLECFGPFSSPFLPLLRSISSSIEDTLKYYNFHPKNFREFHILIGVFEDRKAFVTQRHRSQVVQ